MANISTTAFAKAIDPAVKKHYVDAYNVSDPMIEKVFKVETQTDYNEQEQSYSGLGGIPVVPEAGIISEDVPLQAYGTTYTPVKNAVLVPITREMEMFSKTNEILNVVKMQGKATASEIGVAAANVFNKGFNTSYTSYGDGVPLFSTAHLRADGGANQSNASATSIVFSEANLETGMLAGEQVLNDKGKPVKMFLSTLLLPPALRKQGITVTKSEKRAGTADNDLNAYAVQEFQGAAIDKLLIWPYLGSYMGGSDTAWFLMSPDHEVKWKWAQKPTLDRDTSVGFKNLTTAYRIFYMASKGWSNWLGVWGSQGTGAVYSS